MKASTMWLLQFPAEYHRKISRASSYNQLSAISAKPSNVKGVRDAGLQSDIKLI